MRQPAELVNPYIGSISYMLKSTVPEVMLPYGMARSTPLVDECGDYFCNDHIRGYSLGDASVMPGLDGRFENTLDHSREDFRCYCLWMELEEDGLVAESTVTQHVYLHRFTGANTLRLSFPCGSAELKDGLIRLQLTLTRQEKQIQQYVLVRLDCPVSLRSQGESEWILEVPDTVTCAGAVSYISFDQA